MFAKCEERVARSDCVVVFLILCTPFPVVGCGVLGLVWKGDRQVWNEEVPAGLGHPTHGVVWVVPDFCYAVAQLSFLSFARQHGNFRKSFAKVSHTDPLRGSKGQVLSTLFWWGFRFPGCFKQKPDLLGMASASWRVQRAIFQGNGTFWSLETQKISSPHKFVALGSSPTRNFRATPEKRRNFLRFFRLSSNHRNF